MMTTIRPTLSSYAFIKSVLCNNFSIPVTVMYSDECFKVGRSGHVPLSTINIHYLRLGGGGYFIE